MILDQIQISNVRNVQEAKLLLDPSFNLITGPNGAGKTTLLECVHLLVRGRSFRQGNLNSLITYDTSDMLVTAQGHDQSSKLRLGLEKSRSSKVRMRLNGANVRRISQIAAALPLQVFLPDVSNLVFGAPAARRLWLDWSVFHDDNAFLRSWRLFQRVLRQRNLSLRSKSADWRGWTVQFAEQATAVTRARRRIFGALRERFLDSLAQLAPNIWVDLEYAQGWEDGDLYETLEKDRQVELKYGNTRLGPHRSDIRVQVLKSAGGSKAGLASRLLSRGQGKAVACAMKLAQIRLLNESAKRPVLLLDDVAAEFDDEYGHRFFLALHEMGCQLIATTTQNTDILRIWHGSSETVPHTIRMQDGRVIESPPSL